MYGRTSGCGEPDSVAGRTRLYQRADPPSGAFQRKRFSFTSRLGRAEPAAKRVVTDPAGNRQHREGSELSGKITHQEMELLDVSLVERDFASEGDRRETDSERSEEHTSELQSQ